MPVACASVFMAVLLVPPAGRGEGGSAGGGIEGRAEYKTGASCNDEREERAKVQGKDAGLRRAAPHFRGLYGPGSKDAWIWGGTGPAVPAPGGLFAQRLGHERRGDQHALVQVCGVVAGLERLGLRVGLAEAEALAL